MRICLIGGGELTSKKLMNLNKRLLNDLENPRILIVQLTSDYVKAKKYRPILKKHFENVSSNLVFVDEKSSLKRIKEEIKKSQVIYLPGGNTDFLIQKIKSFKLINLIKKFKGVLIGISAGAYALSKSYIKIDENSFKKIPSFKITDLTIKAHYNNSIDSVLLKLSKKEKIYALKDYSAIIIEKNKKKIIGEVFLFYKNKKIKVNKLK